VAKYLRKINLKMERFILAHSLGGSNHGCFTWACAKAEHNGRERMMEQSCSPDSSQQAKKKRKGLACQYPFKGTPTISNFLPLALTF
jgi:hypothetical protein